MYTKLVFLNIVIIDGLSSIDAVFIPKSPSSINYSICLIINSLPPNINPILLIIE